MSRRFGRGAIVLVGWGAMLLVAAALLLAFGPSVVEIALLGGAGTACVAVGAVVAFNARSERPRAVAPARSGATVLLAIGVALTVFGAEVGPWLLLIGAGLAAAGRRHARVRAPALEQPMIGLVGPFALLALYAWGAARVPRGWPAWRLAAAVAGCATLAAALAGPIDTGAGRNLATHMVQHLLIGVVAPLLLAAAAPVRLALAALPRGQRRALAAMLRTPTIRTLAHPLVATALATATLLAVHLTGLFDAAARSSGLHSLEHAALFWTALAAWIAILGVDPLPHATDAIGALALISGFMVAMTIVGVDLSNDDSPRYEHYPSIALQHDAGAVMWLGGAAVLVPAAIAMAMWALERDERRQRRRERVQEARS